MKFRIASSGQSLSDYLTERGYKGTFIKQLDKIGSSNLTERVFEGTFIKQLDKIGSIEKDKKKVASLVTRKRFPLKVKEAKIIERPRSMPRLYN